jgi:hypothetical protein
MAMPMPISQPNAIELPQTGGPLPSSTSSFVAVPPPVGSSGVGFQNFESDLATGTAAEQQAFGAKEAYKHEQATDVLKQRVARFQQLMSTGADGMKNYAAQVAQTDPELGAQLSKEAESLSPLFQDPQINGETARQAMSGFYQSANNRLEMKNRYQQMGQAKTQLETLRETNREAFEAQRQKNRMQLENTKAALLKALGKGKENLDYKEMYDDAVALETQTTSAIEHENVIINDPNSTFMEKQNAVMELQGLQRTLIFATAAKGRSSLHANHTGDNSGGTPAPAAGATTTPPPSSNKFTIKKIKQNP